MSDVDAGRGEAKAIATKQKASQNVGCLNCFYKPFNCIHFYNKDFIIHTCMHHSNTVILILHTSLSSNVYWLPCRMSSDTGSILPNFWFSLWALEAVYEVCGNKCVSYIIVSVSR